MANSPITTVATMYPAGACEPFPKPTAIGTLPTIAVIGAAVATAMKITPTVPTAFLFKRCTSSAAFLLETTICSVIDPHALSGRSGGQCGLRHTPTADHIGTTNYRLARVPTRL